MAKFRSLIDKIQLSDPAADFRGAQKAEQYRIGREAVYIPAGFKWDYLPYAAIESAEESHRNICSGKCVTVTEVRPSVQLKTEAGSFILNFEKRESVELILKAIGK